MMYASWAELVSDLTGAGQHIFVAGQPIPPFRSGYERAGQPITGAGQYITPQPVALTVALPHDNNKQQ
jgi:hypothetical protein